SAVASGCSLKTLPHQLCGSWTPEPPVVDSSSSPTNAGNLIRRLDLSIGRPPPVTGQLPVPEHLESATRPTHASTAARAGPCLPTAPDPVRPPSPRTGFSI